MSLNTSHIDGESASRRVNSGFISSTMQTALGSKGVSKPVDQSAELYDAVENLLAIIDSPIGRRYFPAVGFTAEAVAHARETLSRRYNG